MRPTKLRLIDPGALVSWRHGKRLQHLGTLVAANQQKAVEEAITQLAVRPALRSKLVIYQDRGQPLTGWKPPLSAAVPGFPDDARQHARAIIANRIREGKRSPEQVSTAVPLRAETILRPCNPPYATNPIFNNRIRQAFL
jgi:hypothetical protein